MQNNLKIAIIGAMDCEIEKIKDKIENITSVDYGKLKIFTGKILAHDIILAKSGVGKVNAAINTQYIIDRFHPDYIINTGIAGGIAPELEVGDIVIASELVQHDFDVTALGYAKGYLCTGVDKDKPTTFYSDEKLIKAFETAVGQVHTLSKIHKGLIATGDTFVSNAEMKKEIRAVFNAMAVEMEGAAIAQCAYTNNIPFMIVRAISDLADCSAPKSLDEVETQMAELSASTIGILLNSL